MLMIIIEAAFMCYSESGLLGAPARLLFIAHTHNKENTTASYYWPGATFTNID